MKRLALAAACLFLIVRCVAAEESIFPTLPDSPSKLLEILKTSGDRYTVRVHQLDFVRESDLPYLVGLLDSKEPCALVDLAESSIYYPGRSTVGHEAAYLIEGFWKRYYPTRLTSQQYEPDIEATKLWYGLWSHNKKLAAQNAPQQVHYEIVMECEQIVFDEAASVANRLLIRNLREKSLAAPELLGGLSLVWDGIEYRRDPKYIGTWNGPAEILPLSSWSTSVSLSEYLVPAELLTAGSHSMAMKDANAASNTATVIIKSNQR